uniref:Muscleblind-like protein n=1 Tax=Meloidogyne javanica TaxID=6303 RepID=A0A915M9K9_MELJA
MTNMFDEQTAAAIINPSVSAAAAALTIAMLNSNAGAGGTNVSTGSVSAVMPQLSLQLNQNQQQLAQLLTGKDSRWLQLEICREYQRGQCVRSEQDCKYAHPPSNVEIQNGRVTACFDSIKGRCSRENPKCKYLHPPQHLKDQLLANGKQNLVMKNLLSQQYSNQMPAMPALAQITQQQYSNPLALQSALSLPYFIPSLYPGQANLLSPVPDPFSAAFQGTQTVSVGAHLPSIASSFPLHHATTLAQLALIQQQQQQPSTAAALLLQQQAAQQQYIALLQQQQQLNAATVLQVSATRSSSNGNDNIEQQPALLGGNRKRSSRMAGLDQQNPNDANILLAQSVNEGAGSSNSSISGQQQHMQLMAAVAAASVNNTNPYISVTSTGSTTKRQKTETTAISNSANTGFKCTPTTVAFGMPLYAAPQFNPYLLPTAPFLPAVPCLLYD